MTRSDANPAYRRLEQYEPLLRLAVPALLVLFLITLAGSAWIQIRDGRKDTLFDAINDIDIIASLSAAKLGTARAPADRVQASAQLERLAKDMPPIALTQNRSLMLVDQAGAILAVYPPMEEAPAKLTDILGEAQPLMLFADRAGVMTIKLPGGIEGMATVRALHASSGQIALVQPMPHILSGWWTRTIGHVSLLGATIMVPLGIGVAYVMQANRARAADEVCE
ncbi:MAG: hypothetical protein ACJ8BH_15830 [Microvirga sp.]